MNTRDAASAPAAARLRLVTDLEPAHAAVPPELAAARSSVRAMFFRLRRHGDGRKDLLRGLALLGPEWRIVRGLPGVDTLLVGPTGAYALVITAHPGGCVAVQGDTVGVDGRRLDVVPHARAAAAQLTRALADELAGLRVHAVVAIVEALPRWALHEQPHDGSVSVFPGRVVPAFITSGSRALDAERVVAIARAAVAGPYRRPARPALPSRPDLRVGRTARLHAV